MTEVAHQIQQVEFKCAQCGFEHSWEQFINAIIRHGLIALSGETDGFLGWSCIGCDDHRTTLIPVEIDCLNKTIEAINYELKLVGFSGLCYHSFPYKLSSEENEFVSAFEKQISNDFQSYSCHEVEPDSSENELTGLYCSYIYDSPIMGPAVSVLWYFKDQVQALVEQENNTRKKAFPRYLVYDPIYSTIENLCWRDRIQFDFLQRIDLDLDINEILSNPAKKRVVKSFEFLTILDTVHIDHLRLYTSKNKSQIHVLPTQISLNGLESDKETPLIIKGIQHEELSEYLWSTFRSDSSQDLIITMADSFISEYINLICRTDCKYDSIWALKESYLKNLYDALSSKYKRKKIKDIAKAKRREYVKEAEAAFPSVNIISEDLEIDDIKIRLSKISALPQADSFFITGERGTGKELFAKAIHEASKQPGKIVKVDCGAIPKKLFESELFGYSKGAFTGANADKRGLFDSAANGVLFFDEIGNLPKSLQPKLLRAIQDRQYVSVGSSTVKTLNAKFIFATNKDLLQMVNDELFMPDLYDRFSLPKFKIPPLRLRKSDIEPLVYHFISKYDWEPEKATDSETIKASEDFLRCLKEYDWPGNVRELEKTIKMILIMRQAHDDRSDIVPAEIPDGIIKGNKLSSRVPSFKKNLPGNQQITDEQIRYWMKEFKDNKTQVAKKLGVRYETILRRCKKLNP